MRNTDHYVKLAEEAERHGRPAVAAMHYRDAIRTCRQFNQADHYRKLIAKLEGVKNE